MYENLKAADNLVKARDTFKKIFGLVYATISFEGFSKEQCIKKKKKKEGMSDIKLNTGLTQPPSNHVECSTLTSALPLAVEQTV